MDEEAEEDGGIEMNLDEQIRQGERQARGMEKSPYGSHGLWAWVVVFLFFLAMVAMTHSAWMLLILGVPALGLWLNRGKSREDMERWDRY